MIGISKDSLPYQQKLTYPMLRYIRLARSLSQEKFSEVCHVDRSVLAKLERGELDFSIHYESKIMEGIKSLNISQYELDAIKTLLLLKENK